MLTRNEKNAALKRNIKTAKVKNTQSNEKTTKI